MGPPESELVMKSFFDFTVEDPLPRSGVQKSRAESIKSGPSTKHLLSREADYLNAMHVRVLPRVHILLGRPRQDNTLEAPCSDSLADRACVSQIVGGTAARSFSSGKDNGRSRPLTYRAVPRSHLDLCKRSPLKKQMPREVFPFSSTFSQMTQLFRSLLGFLQRRLSEKSVTDTESHDGCDRAAQREEQWYRNQGSHSR